MKNLKKEISELMNRNRSESKQQVLCLTETETPGIFEFRDKIVTEKEIIELQKGYEKTVRFVHHK